MKNFIESLNSTLAMVEEEKKKISNQFDEQYSEKIDIVISKISKEYEDLEKVVGDRGRWFEICTDSEVGIKVFTQKVKHEIGSREEQFQHSVLRYKRVNYALNSKAEGLFLGGETKIRPLKEALLVYLKNEDLIKSTIMGNYKKNFEERLNNRVIAISDKKEFAELIDSHY